MCCGLTKKAEPPPTRGVNRDSGTDSANGGWLRRLVRPHGHLHNCFGFRLAMAKQISPAINESRNKSQQIATIILTVPGSIVAANLESGRGTMMLKSINNMPTI